MKLSQIQWFVLITPAIGNLRQEDPEFRANLGCVVSPHMKKIKEKLGLRKWLRASDIVTEGLGLVPSTHMEVHNV